LGFRSKGFYWLAFLVMAEILFILIYHYLWPAFCSLLAALFPVVLPFALGAFLALIIDPLVNWAERHRIPRGLSSLFLLLLTFLGISKVLFWLIRSLVGEIRVLIQEMPAITEKSLQFTQGAFSLLERFYLLKERFPPEIYAYLERAWGAQAQAIQGWLEQLVRGLSSLLTYMPQAWFLMILSLVAAFFFSRDRDWILERLTMLLPPSLRQEGRGLLSTFVRGSLGYLRAEILLVSLQTAQLVGGLCLLRVKYAFLFAVLIGVFDFIPILGPGVVFLPWIIYELIIGNFLMSLALALLYGAVVALRQILQPKLVAVTLGLHPLTTLVALYVGFKLMGVVGLALGPLSVLMYKAYRASRSSQV